MTAASAKLLVQPTDLSLWVGEVKQLIEQTELARAQRIVDAFRICHPTEVWPHILKAWLAVESQAPRTAMAESDAVMESPLYPGLSESEKEFIQALRSRSEAALRTQEELPKQDPKQPPEVAAQPEGTANESTVEILPRRPISVKKLAFYLPQFHPIPENDEWWGEGFTEWNNVSRAKPFFPGHWQPRRPGPMGFYDLRVPATMNKQFELARRYGLDGFCFYYYWFNGRKLLEKPLEMLMAGETDPFPFCICWVNETWTRSWDGMSGEVLIEANQSLEGTKSFIRDIEPVLKNENYICVDGRPLLLVYCAQKLEDPQGTVKDWREFAKDSGIGELHICAVQSFGFDDPTPLGFDAAVEFPPHCVPHKHEGLTYCRELSDEERDRLGVDCSFSGEIRDYEFYSRCGRIRPKEPYLLYKGCMLAWDNTARRMESAHVYANFSVSAYQDWLASCIDYCARDPSNPHNESFVFINAWNEWAEGCTLEPDHHFGYALLRATQTATLQAKWIEPFTSYKHGLPMGEHVHSSHCNVLVFGHDAHMHGAQINLLSMVRNLVKRMGNKVHVFLLNGGELVNAYKKLAPTIVISDDLSNDQPQVLAILKEFRSRGFDKAILNTTVTGRYTQLLKQEGFMVTNLIHELPNLIRSYQLDETLYEIASYSDDIVFSTNYVKEKIKEEFKLPLPNSRVLPQGINFNESYKDKQAVRISLRNSMEIGQNELVVMACGFADFRKGVDIFVRIAQNVIKQHGNCRFIWVGRIDPSIEAYIQSDIHNMGLKDKVVITGNLPLPFEYYLASDIFLLTSREDPLPSVVMEAFDAGLPVIGFEGAGGFVELLDTEDRGKLVPYMDESAMSEAILSISRKLDSGYRYNDNHAFARSRFDYVEYLGSLLTQPNSMARQYLTVTGAPLTVSAVIPNYNYKRFLGGRLSSVINQTTEISEVILLDDCSRDGSLDYARQYLVESNANYRIIANEVNSGLVAAQWKKGIDISNSEFVWIAEADDYCEPTMLGELLFLGAKHKENHPSICFCESIMVDALGNLGATYLDYHCSIPEVHGELFKQDFILGGNDFIFNCLGVTNVIPNASACILKLDSLRELDWDELTNFRLSSDWLTYLLLASTGSVAFTSRSLNYHRRHIVSVINSNLSHPVKLKEEASRIQAKAAELISDSLRKDSLSNRSSSWLSRVFGSN